MKDFLKQVLLIWIGVNLSKQTFKEQKSKVGRVSNMKPQEIINIMGVNNLFNYQINQPVFFI